MYSGGRGEALKPKYNVYMGQNTIVEFTKGKIRVFDAKTGKELSKISVYMGQGNE